MGRTSQGVRGLKLGAAGESLNAESRTSQGVRGLKRYRMELDHTEDESHLARGAWIETMRIL